MQNFLQELRKFWKYLAAGQKISIVLSTAAIALLAAAIIFWSSRPRYQILYGHLDPKEMSEVIACLEEQAVPYKIGSGGKSVLVPHKAVYSLRMKLAAKGISSGVDTGFEIFDRNSIGISDFVQKTNYLRALNGELSRTICELKNVRNAKVLIVLPENKLLSAQAKITPTASVFVDTGGKILDESSVNSIRYLVANAVEGLKLNNVSVVDNNGKVLSEEFGEDKSFGAASTHLKIRSKLEHYFAHKVESMLERIVGQGKVVTRVSVDLETDTSTIVEEIYDPESQVVRSQSVVENVLAKQESTPVANAENANAESEAGEGASNSTSKESQKNKTIAYDINKSTKEIVKVPGRVNKISASVLLDTLYKGDQPAQRSKADLDKIKKMVLNSLGIDSEFASRVTVEEIPFPQQPKLQIQENSPSIIDQIFQWGVFLKNFVAVWVAIILFLIFLKLLKSSKVTQGNTIELIEGPSVNYSEGSVMPNTSNTPTPALLNDLIRQKPENVSAALKEWSKKS